MKKIALINDLTGFGRCSLTVSLPILSYMKIECLPVPTSILSNHTGFDSYYMKDLTDEMPAYISKWKEMGLKMDGIYTGFLGSYRQIEYVKDFIAFFKNESTQVIVDPVMGDDGKVYPTYDDRMVESMKELVELADIITPNVTEACLLTQTPYKKDWTWQELEDLVHKLAQMGPDKVVVTGIEHEDQIVSFLYEKDSLFSSVLTEKTGQARPGTGDVFASIIAGDAIHHRSFRTSVEKASYFVRDCLEVSDKNGIDLLEGVCFEEILDTLKND